MWFTLMTHVGKGKGDLGTEWAMVHEGKMREKQAMDMCERLGRFFWTRLFQGASVGKMVCEFGEDKAVR